MKINHFLKKITSCCVLDEQKQKRHYFQIGSYGIQFHVHIEQRQRSKKKKSRSLSLDVNET